MNQRKQTGGPRPPQGKNLQNWYRRRHWPHHRRWRDYDWYDDWDGWDSWDWYIWDDYTSESESPNNPQMKKPTAGTASPEWTAYQQGFKDGWMAALDYMMSGPPGPSEPYMPPSPPPAPPVPPIEGAPE